MEYEQVKEWLDNLVRIQKEASQMHVLTNSIRASLSGDSVLIYEGIDVVADIMGIQLTEEETEDNYSHKYFQHFVYEGVEFVSFSNMRVGAYAGTYRKSHGC